LLPGFAVDDIKGVDLDSEAEDSQRLIVEQLAERLPPGEVLIEVGFLIAIVGGQDRHEDTVHNVVARRGTGERIKLLSAIWGNDDARELLRRQVGGAISGHFLNQDIRAPDPDQVARNDRSFDLCENVEESGHGLEG
jgi:hypothetical protein